MPRQVSLSQRQRHVEKERERRQRFHNIFESLRHHGNFRLGPRATDFDYLVAALAEAGWEVESDGRARRREDMAVTAVPCVVVAESSDIPDGLPCCKAIPIQKIAAAPHPQSWDMLPEDGDGEQMGCNKKKKKRGMTVTHVQGEDEQDVRHLSLPLKECRSAREAPVLSLA
ncbi:hypothetical protein CBR_g4506 [Chara braunii]|uniref:BES1/BZR1 plant transcription factor N-terminal domain-containing protein n=1 Tax=Chara braunii TaxID=69332 RepID=A0A388KI20_CHABU|nr:hypothetical protein CBR_g4506 [Chara braunii]|eukprot:GBG69676.1 hypothetical protein CBR_g4506 [Chara braunii]